MNEISGMNAGELCICGSCGSEITVDEAQAWLIDDDIKNLCGSCSDAKDKAEKTAGKD